MNGNRRRRCRSPPCATRSCTRCSARARRAALARQPACAARALRRAGRARGLGCDRRQRFSAAPRRVDLHPRRAARRRRRTVARREWRAHVAGVDLVDGGEVARGRPDTRSCAPPPQSRGRRPRAWPAGSARTCSASAAVPPATSWPVAGSRPIWPEQNSQPPASIAWRTDRSPRARGRWKWRRPTSLGDQALKQSIVRRTKPRTVGSAALFTLPEPMQRVQALM